MSSQMHIAAEMLSLRADSDVVPLVLECSFYCTSGVKCISSV